MGALLAELIFTLQMREMRVAAIIAFLGLLFCSATLVSGAVLKALSPGWRRFLHMSFVLDAAIWLALLSAPRLSLAYSSPLFFVVLMSALGLSLARKHRARRFGWLPLCGLAFLICLGQLFLVSVLTPDGALFRVGESIALLGLGACVALFVKEAWFSEKLVSYCVQANSLYLIIGTLVARGVRF